MRLKAKAFWLLSISLVFAVPKIADAEPGFRLQFQRHDEHRQGSNLVLRSRDYAMPIWFAGDKARIDRKDDSIIYRRGDKKLFILYHAKHAYQAFDIPFTMEELVTQEERDLIDVHVRPSDFELKIEALDDVAQIGGCTTRHFLVSVVHEVGGSYTYDLRTCTRVNPGIDVALIEELIRYYYELHPLAHAWIQRVLELPGMAVEQTVTSNSGRGFTNISTKRLQSITRTTVDPALFSPPQSYERIPLGPMVRLGPHDEHQ